MNLPNKQKVLNSVNLKEKLGLASSDFLVIYQGRLKPGRGLLVVIESVIFTKEKVKLVILGDGTMKEKLVKYVDENNLKNKVFFLEKVDSEKLLSYTRGADCGILLLEPINLNTVNAAPNKLFEYINAGIPIISGNGTEINVVFNKYKLGLRVEIDSKEIAVAMDKMSNMDLSTYKENCKIASEEYNWENQEYILKDIINC
jgi:glycosyltransferase involved in cell wall biosynthesis